VITAESLPAQYRRGTYRLLSPEATLARITPLLDACGITRCADVTHLDTLGIPVYCAIRPDATVQQISNGKGLTAVSAQVSALMEGIELFHAESPDAERLQRASVRALHSEGCAFLHPSDLVGFESSHYYADTLELEWLEGTNVESGGPVLVPASAVCFHRRPHLHVTTTNGLASGNHTTEASLHGLYEVIERNAAAELLGHKRIPIREKCHVLALDSIDHPDLRGILDRIAAADSQLVVLQVDSSVAVPTFWAILLNEDSLISGSTFNTGWGTHLDPAVAFVRAVTEAAQSRATMIHGSREDCLAKPVFRDAVTTRSSTAFQYFKNLRADSTWDALFADHDVSGDLADHHATVLDLLARAGHRRVVCCDLTKPAIDISVVKVLVPSLRLHSA
jgi:ribosomal protein S12 methylthiotransferase accessory factor